MSRGTCDDRIVEHLGVGLRQLVRVFAEIAGLLAQRRVAQIGEIDLVDLDEAAAGRREVADFLAVDARDVGVEVADVRVGALVHRLAAAAKMQRARRRERDLGGRVRDRLQEREIIDEDAMRVAKLALHLQGRRGMFAHALLVVKLDRNLGLHQCHVGELKQEVALPAAAVVFAVGDDLEPEVFLQADDVADRGLLDTLELGVCEFLFGRCLARFDQVVGPNQAADVVRARKGAGRQRHALLLAMTAVVGL